ncbi:TrbI/VirB10 family protein [Phenylobacterium sp.]|uniref:TrbI/VirB10 family protein n=1 Tax=Phenylobacterium sp. TaxID=1871053 RepID=UPI003BA9ADED
MSAPQLGEASATPAAALRLRADPPRVMRLSRKTLAAMGAVAALAVGGALIYALQTRGPAKTRAELYSTDSHTTAEGLTSAPKDYAQIPQLGPPLPGDLGRPILSAHLRGAEGPAPPMGAPALTGPQASAADAARQAREAARTSRLFASGEERTAAADRIASAPADLSLPGSLGPDGVAAPAVAASDTPDQNDQAAKRAFLDAAAPTSTTASGRLNPPVSPHVLQAGGVIAAALITGARSDLPGPITAQVTQNVYDSPTGKILLIPQGARLIGEYDSEVSFGQTRILLAWDRLILPDGRSITLDRQPGVDGAGYAGLQDRTDNHWGMMAKAAMLSTLLGVGAELGSDSDDELARAIRRGTQDTINQTGQQIVRRQMNVQPLLTIRPGFPLRVLVTRDLVLGPISSEAR